jgi:hypothetical protein
MPAENERAEVGDLGRWVILALLLIASLAAYFVYSPRVGPVIRPAAAVVETP